MKWILVLPPLFTLFGVSVALAFCQSQDEQKDEDKQLRDLVRSLAPMGGTGPIEHRYESGQLMDRVSWDKYQVKNIEYFTKNGLKLCNIEQGGAIDFAIFLDEDGNVKSIRGSDPKNHLSKGPQFFFRDNKLVEIITVRDDEDQSHVIYRNGEWRER